MNDRGMWGWFISESISFPNKGHGKRKKEKKQRKEKKRKKKEKKERKEGIEENKKGKGNESGNQKG